MTSANSKWSLDSLGIGTRHKQQEEQKQTEKIDATTTSTNSLKQWLHQLLFETDYETDRVYIRHKVESEDTVVGIALLYDVSVDALRQQNRLFVSESLAARESLRIPIQSRQEFEARILGRAERDAAEQRRLEETAKRVATVIGAPSIAASMVYVRKAHGSEKRAIKLFKRDRRRTERKMSIKKPEKSVGNDSLAAAENVEKTDRSSSSSSQSTPSPTTTTTTTTIATKIRSTLRKVTNGAEQPALAKKVGSRTKKKLDQSVPSQLYEL